MTKDLRRPLLTLSVQWPGCTPELNRQVISRTRLSRWVRISLQPYVSKAEITLRFVDIESGQALNAQYRHKNYATNVLTFPYTNKGDTEVVADIVLCPAVVQTEAAERGIHVLDHLAHLVIHGVLHAQGFDHNHPQQAVEMERIEVMLLAKLGISNPYFIER